MKKFLTIFMILLFAVMASACTPKHGLTIPDVDKTLQLLVGETQLITPTLTNETDVLNWTSSDVAIATVNNGTIQAISAGTATITVVIQGTNVSETVMVTVSYAASTSVTINGNGTVIIGTTLQLTGVVLPSNANPALTWASSNESIATVNNGLVTGVAVGTVTITATAQGTSLSKTVTITVITPDPTGITVAGVDTVEVGNTETYTASVAPTLASQVVTWSVDDSLIATINSTTGELTALKGGSVVVTATSVSNNTITGSKTVTVTHPAPVSINIVGDDEAPMGVDIAYTATVSPTHAIQTVTWSVSDTSKATIEAETGVLTGIALGMVEVRATSTVLGTVVGVKQVTVIQSMPNTITISGDQFLLVGTSSTPYSATIAPSSAEQGVSWSVNNTSIASINATTGVLTTVAAGTVIVTATSTILNTIKGMMTVVVYTNQSLVIDDGYASLDMGAKVTLGTTDYYFGYTAFANTADLTGKLMDDTTVELKDGTYSGNFTVDKNNVSFFGTGTVTGIITVNTGVSGLTIDGLTFTDAGQVSITPDGGVSNFTFINNHVYDTKANMSLVYFPNNGTAINQNFVFENNVFEIINATSISSRYIRGGNIENLRIMNNYFKGIIGHYTDGIRIEGNDSLSAAGIGAAGEVIIRDNTFETIGQRSIWIRRYSATLVDISGNSFDQSGDQNYGGGVQIEVWIPGQTTEIILKRNELKNIGGSFAFRINNATTWTGSETWSALIRYNAFIDMYNTAPYDDFVQAYSTAAAHLIDADFNLFFQNGESIVPAVDRMPFVGSYGNQITTFEALEEAILFDMINESGDSLLVVGTHEKITKLTYATLAEAYTAAQANDTILLLPGTYSSDMTIAKDDLTIVSLNGEKDPTDLTQTRQAEAVMTGKITLGKELKNFTISGIMFTGNAQIVNTIGSVGSATVPLKNIEGFTFANNIVETGLASGNGFIYFVEAASSYSHDLVFVNNTFKTTNTATTLSAMVYIDNVVNLTIVDNVCKDMVGDAFYVYDTTKGLSGIVLVAGNHFENITGSGFWANWMSPLPGEIGKVRIVNNQFKNVDDYGVYLGRMNNSDFYSEISILYNTFETIGTGVHMARVHNNSHVHINYNKFLAIPVTAYVVDEKRSDTSSPVTLDATMNLYMNAGVVVTPDAAKFSGAPDYAGAYTTEAEVPVYLGEGELMMNTLVIDAIVGHVYVADKYQLTYTFTPEEATATDVIWDSSDITVATVSESGEVTGLKSGTVVITATSADNPTLKATIEITVTVFETIELRHADNGVIKVGEASTLTAMVYPSSIIDTITYVSNTPAIATVSTTGVVTGVSEGVVVIEAAIGTRIVATITVVVKNEPVSQVDPIQFLIDANVGNALMRNVTTFGSTTKTELVYGAVSKIWFSDVVIIEALAPIGSSRPGEKLTSLEFIIIHDTGNNSIGANGLMHRNYLINNDPGVSWHYVVDDEYAYHQVPNDEVAYHAGDGSRPFGLTDTGVLATTEKPVLTISADGYYEFNGTKSTVLAPKSDTNAILTTSDITPSGIYTTIGTNNNYFINNSYYNTTYKKISNQGGNRHSIGIESCVDQGSDLYATWQNFAKLVAQLLDENDLGLDRVLQHNNMSGKNCPQTLRMADLYSYFMEMIAYEYELRTTFKDYTFTFVSNNPSIVNNTGKIINKPKATTEVSYTVTVTGPSSYNQSVTLYATIPGTKILG